MPHQLTPRAMPAARRRRGPGSLVLCGTGMRLGQMTLETAQALRRCEKILCVNLPREVFQQVREAFARAEDATADYPMGRGFTEDALCERLQDVCSGGRDAAILFLGHPLLYSAAPELIRRCRRSRRPCRILAGLSSIDASLAAAGSFLEEQYLDLGGAGLVVQGAPEILRRGLALDPRCSTLILNIFRLWDEIPRGNSIWESWVNHLERYYSPDHPAAWVACGADLASDRTVLTTVSKLRRTDLPVASNLTLLLPGRVS